MNARVRKKLARRKQRIQKRLDKQDLRGCSKPMITASNIHYEVGERGRGIGYGGIGAMHLLVRKLALAEAIDRRLHVLNFAYNALCDGTCLQDIELRRNDEVFLDALGARRIPDPTTAGDFCRRFTESDLDDLRRAIDDARLNVWRRQPEEFFDEAVIDMDSTFVITTGQCKVGMDMSYKGEWSYHPLLLTLANTGEILSLVNRPGNRPSEEGAADEVDWAILRCRSAGFRTIRLRGDTAFSQT